MAHADDDRDNERDHAPSSTSMNGEGALTSSMIHQHVSLCHPGFTQYATL
jgi:hypothetical protein